MKKLIIAAAVIVAASFTSCTKENNIKPSSVQLKTFNDDHAKQDVGQGD